MRRRQAKRTEESTFVASLHETAELPAQDVENERSGTVQEMSGFDKRLEANDVSLRAELEGDWHGHEAASV